MRSLRRTCFNSAMLFSALLLLLVSVAAQAEQARWSCVHGTSGHIQNEANIQNPSTMRYGWGLDFEEKPGTSNWVHFAVPSVYYWSARYVALKYWTGSADAFIDQVDVWSLNGQVESFEDLDLSGGWHIEVLDLGVPPVENAVLNISVRVKAGVEMMSHRFAFSGACAYLIPED